MSLRRQSLSPTANLLRNSRLFSLPNPLPRPSVADPFGSGSTKESPTATLPYPTHQAIATTPSSAARGDWGLKRPLPSRSHILQTSNPVVKIKQWDTIEHITDFDSAADHVRTREKFQELGIPMLNGLSQFRETDLTYAPPKSVFEKRADVTAYDTEEGVDGATMFLGALRANRDKRNGELKKRKLAIFRAKKQAKQDAKIAASAAPGNPAAEAMENAAPTASEDSSAPFVPFTPPSQDVLSLNNIRWKHDGPWLPGMSATEFTSYLANQIATRKKDFNQYLVEYVRGQIYMRRRQASRQNETVSMDAEEAKAELKAKEAEWSNITKSDISAGISAIRAQCAADPLTSDLVTKLIIPFLRLPPMKLKSTEYSATSKRSLDNYRFSDETTPVSTHPSAGLSYLRTKAFLSNHPILGPQANNAPIQSLVIQPRQTSTSTETTARLGVGGFVADDEHSQTSSMTNRNTLRTEAGIQTLDVDTYGGKKLPVLPQFASVRPDGRILVKVKRSSGPEVAVSRGQLEDRPPARENTERAPMDGFRGAKSGVAELDEAMSEQREKKGASDFFGMLRKAGVEGGAKVEPK